jgi:hypothetical protein
LWSAVSISAQDDPYTGTWILDAARSGGESRSQTLTIEVRGDEESYRSELVWPDGRRQVTTYVAKYDGREYPSETVLEGGGQKEPVKRDDTVILRKVDGPGRERIWKQGGRIVRILRRSVSADGRTFTSQVVDVDERGNETVASTLVFDRR